MNRYEILNMQAGRNTDALIAETVMEYLNVGRRTLGNAGTMLFYEKDGDEFRLVPKFSTDIAAAWEVVEKLCGETGCDVVKVCKRDPDLLLGNWSCNFGRGFEAFGETAELAICRAALLCVASI